MPRIRGVLFRRPGATSKDSANVNLQKKIEVQPPSFGTSVSKSNHLQCSSQTTADGATVLSTDSAAVFDIKNNFPKECGQPLKITTPHKTNELRRIKSRSRSRKKKRDVGEIILCADDSARLFRDDRIAAEAGSLRCVSQSHETITSCAKKLVQDRDMNSNDLETEQEDLNRRHLPPLLSHVTPDAAEKKSNRFVHESLDNCKRDIDNESKVEDSKEAYSPNSENLENLDNLTKNTTDNLVHDVSKGSKTDSNEEFIPKSYVMSAKKVDDVTFPEGNMIIHEDNHKWDISNESKVDDNKEPCNLNTQFKNKNTLTYSVNSNASKGSSTNSSAEIILVSSPPKLFSAKKVIGVTSAGGDTITNETVSTANECTDKQQIYTRQQVLSLNKRVMYPWLNNTPNNRCDAEEKDLYSEETPNKFVKEWTTFFEDFDSEQNPNTRQSEQHHLKPDNNTVAKDKNDSDAALSETECNDNNTVAIDKNDSDTALSETECNDHVRNACVGNTAPYKFLDHIISKAGFFSKRLEIRKRHEMISTEPKFEATEAVTCEVFNMCSLAIITDVSLAKVQTAGDNSMCPCACRNGVMLDVVLCNNGVCDTLRWTLSCSVGNTPSDENNIIDSLRSTPEYATLVWEAQTLHVLHARVTKWLNASELAAMFPKPEALRFERGCDGKPNAMLDLSVSPVTASLPRKSTARTRSHNVKILGTLQDIFNLHVQYCVGPIPEPVIACLVLQVLEIIAVLHHCGVAHNNLGLESFILIQEENIDPSDMSKNNRQFDWSLRLIDFGEKASILKCHLNDHSARYCDKTEYSNTSATNNEFGYQSQHYKKDLHSLAGIVQALLLGGATLMELFGDGYEKLIMPVISDNCYLRGRLAWKELINTLLQSNMGLINTKFLSSPNGMNYHQCQFLQNKRDQNNNSCDLTHAVALLDTVSSKVDMTKYLEQALQHKYHMINVTHSSTSPLTKPPNADKIFQGVSSSQYGNNSSDDVGSQSSRESEESISKPEAKSRVQRSRQFNSAPDEKIRNMAQQIALYKSKIEEMERIIEEKNRLLMFEQLWRKKELSQGSDVPSSPSRHNVEIAVDALSPNRESGWESKQRSSRSSLRISRIDQTNGKIRTNHEDLTPHKRQRSSPLPKTLKRAIDALSPNRESGLESKQRSSKSSLRLSQIDQTNGKIQTTHEDLTPNKRQRSSLLPEDVKRSNYLSPNRESGQEFKQRSSRSSLRLSQIDQTNVKTQTYHKDLTPHKKQRSYLLPKPDGSRSSLRLSQIGKKNGKIKTKQEDIIPPKKLRSYLLPKQDGSRSSLRLSQISQSNGKIKTDHKDPAPYQRQRSSLLSGLDYNFPQQQQKRRQGRVVVCLDDSSDSDDDSEFG